MKKNKIFKSTMMLLAITSGFTLSGCSKAENKPITSTHSDEMTLNNNDKIEQNELFESSEFTEGMTVTEFPGLDRKELQKMGKDFVLEYNTYNLADANHSYMGSTESYEYDFTNNIGLEHIENRSYEISGAKIVEYRANGSLGKILVNNDWVPVNSHEGSNNLLFMTDEYQNNGIDYVCNYDVIDKYTGESLGTYHSFDMITNYENENYDVKFTGVDLGIKKELDGHYYFQPKKVGSKMYHVQVNDKTLTGQQQR